MGFSQGDRVGPYEILTPLGLGGMGEVFRAFDPRLGRTVALKILSAESARTPEYLKRFEQEARAASALNHPNVVGVYDIGSHLGLPFFAMELVEGRDLRDLLAEGPFPLDRALDVAVQMAEGAAAAHVRGVVHRDLKPENVMVTPEERVKLLDFGLAKRVVDLSSPADVERAGGEQLTGEGLIVGTVGYMAPEQARGGEVGPPADQFSLGAILYELLTGRRAFQQPTAVETLSSILHDDPSPAETPDGPVPPEVQWILDRCLAKDPERRYASTQDLVRDLKHIGERRRRAAALVSGAIPAADRSALEGIPPQEASPGGPERPPRPSPRRGLLAAVLAVGALAGFLAGRVIPRESKEGTPSWQRITFSRGLLRTARFAPGGDGVVFSAAWNAGPLTIHLSRPGPTSSPGLSLLVPLPLPLPSADLAAVSPSGEIAVVLGCAPSHGGVCRGTLARTALAGGPPREVMAAVQQADYGPDGQGFIVIREFPERSRLEYPAGNVLYETKGHLSHPRLSPDGKRIAFVDHPVRENERGHLSIVSLSGQVTPLTPEARSLRGVAWAPHGKEVWFTGAFSSSIRALHAVDLSGRLRVVVSVPTTLTLHDIAADGRVLLARELSRIEAHARLDGAEGEREVSWLDGSVVRDISADGKLLLLDEASEALGDEPVFCVREASGFAARPLGAGRGIAISPDGARIMAKLPASGALALVPSAGGPLRLLQTARNVEFEGGAFLPGDVLLLAGHDGGDRQPTRLFLRSPGGADVKVVPSEEIRSPRAGFAVSPDGKMAAGVAPSRRIVLLPLDGGPARPLAGGAQEDVPIRFTADGHSLFVYARDEIPARVARIDLETGRREPVRDLAPRDIAGVERIRDVVITPDGSSWAYSAFRTLSVLYVATGLR